MVLPEEEMLSWTGIGRSADEIFRCRIEYCAYKSQVRMPSAAVMSMVFS